jgi:hypothetical protein
VYAQAAALVTNVAEAISTYVETHPAQIVALGNAAQFAQQAMSAGCGNGGCVGDGGQTVGPSGNSGQTASPGGPQDPLGPFKNEAESYQFRTSGTRFGKEPTLQVNIDGKSERRLVKSCVKVQAGNESFLKCIDRMTA